MNQSPGITAGALAFFQFLENFSEVMRSDNRKREK